VTTVKVVRDRNIFIFKNSFIVNFTALAQSHEGRGEHHRGDGQADPLKYGLEALVGWSTEPDRINN
jgi:hypothetical protein